MTGDRNRHPDGDVAVAYHEEEAISEAIPVVISEVVSVAEDSHLVLQTNPEFQMKVASNAAGVATSILTCVRPLTRIAVAADVRATFFVCADRQELRCRQIDAPCLVQ